MQGRIEEEVILALRSRRENRPEFLFTIVWSIVVLIATIQHLRFEYYLAVNLALLAAVFAAWALGYGLEKTVAALRAPGKGKTFPLPEITAVALAVLLTGTLAGASAAANFGYAWRDVAYVALDDDWRDALEWMNTHTPDSGVDYYAIYGRDGFRYPAESYGIMSWWDHVHRATRRMQP